MIKIYKKFLINKLKRAFVLFACLLALFFISYRNFETTQKAHVNSISAVNYINHQEISPKDLFLDSWQLIKTEYWDSTLNEQNWNYWKKKYLNEIKTYDDVYVAINTIIASLDDPYSKFLSKSEFKEQNANIDSKTYGIGINIASISGKIFVFNVLKGAPADIAGIKQGDMILAVDNQDARGKSIFQVSQYIKGPQNPVNTNVELTVLRGGKKITKKIRREEIKIKTIEYKNLENGIGYIRILSFISQETPNEFLGAMEKLKPSKGLILDLRGNTGGLFQNAIFVSNLFLKKGAITHVIGQDGHLISYKADKESFIYQQPLVVLVDSETASSSEIVTGALQDHKRAKIVGAKTFGKGMVQKIYPLPAGTGMNLTFARYFTPDGHEINKKGITPDFEVPFTKDDIEKNNDRQLDFAYNLVKKEVGFTP